MGLKGGGKEEEREAGRERGRERNPKNHCFLVRENNFAEAWLIEGRLRTNLASC